MTPKNIKLIVFIVLLVHGIGHIQGIISSFGIKFTANTSAVSWLLKSLGDKTNSLICLILYAASAVFGILCALALYQILGGMNWQTLAIITAIFSSLTLILFPNALALFFNKIGAISVNLLIYYSIVFNGQWPVSIFED